jgi:hypothetical protein
MRIVVLVLIAALIAVTGSAVAYGLTRPDSSVSQFNDGFRDAKADDCQQGVAVACQWLTDNR